MQKHNIQNAIKLSGIMYLHAGTRSSVSFSFIVQWNSIQYCIFSQFNGIHNSTQSYMTVHRNSTLSKTKEQSLEFHLLHKL